MFDKEGNYKETIIGTGPFQLDPATSQKGTRYVFKKNPTYWEQGKPYLDEVRILILLQDSTAKAGFQAKQVDVLPELFISDIPDLQKGNPNAQFLRYIQPRAASWRLGQAKGQVTTDLRIRKALNMSMDRDEINKVFAGGEGQWGFAGAMEGLFTEAETKQIIGKYDPEGAKRLLAEAGYPNGVKMFFPTDNSRTQLEMTLFQLVQAQWKKVGIDMDLQMMERTQQRQFRRTGTFDLDATINLSPLEADNDTILFGEYHSSMGNSTNNAKVADPELDRLLEAQRREPNLEKRKQALRAAAMRIWEQQWQAPMVFPPRWDIVAADIRNFRQHLSIEGPHLYSWRQK